MTGTDAEHASSSARVASRTHAPDQSGYFWLSQRPLHILLFLSPLLIAYEFGAVRYLGAAGSDGAQTIAAWGMLARVFENFGVVGFHLPAVLLFTVLVIWHLLLRDPWVVRIPVLIGMAMEACVWTVPLTIVAMLLATEPAAQTEAAGADLHSLSLGARLTISFGAGLYEELLFRMILIAAAHALLVDVMRMPNWLGAVLAVMVSAAAFALYHRQPGVGVGDLLFYGIAGAYFGALYLGRGFGIVVCVHTLYDLLVLVVIGNQGG